MGMIDSYLGAKQKFAEIDDRITDYANLLLAVGSGLQRHRARFGFYDADKAGTDVFAPTDALSMNINDYPSIDTILADLNEWHKAKSALESAWRGLPAEIAGSLRPPLKKMMSSHSRTS